MWLEQRELPSFKICCEFYPGNPESIKAQRIGSYSMGCAPSQTKPDKFI